MATDISGFDVAGARKSGASDDQIAEFLSGKVE